VTSFILLRPLWLIAIIPLFIIAWFIRKQHKNKGWSNLLAPEIAQFLLQDQTNQAKRQNLFLPLVITWLLTVIALAGPSFSYTERPVTSLTQAKVVVLDMSLSMRATDLKPNRLTQMRFKVTDLLAANKEGEVALIAYAGDAFVISPLTTDTNTLLNLLPNLSPEIMPSKGSNPVAGIKQAIVLLTNSGYQQGQILLVTDGITVSQSEDINQLLAETDHNLSVLAIGTKQGAPITLKNGKLLKNNLGTIVIPQVETARLSNLANQLNGQFQQLNHGSQILTDLFATKINMSNTNATELKTIQRNDDGIWLVPLIALMVALSFRKQLFFTLLLPFLAMPVLLLQSNNSFAADGPISISTTPTSKQTTSIWKNSDENATILFNQQDYKNAADSFSNSNWQASALYKAGEYQQAADIWAQQQGADASYNLGNAYTQLGDLEKADAAYKESLKLNPDNKDAQANLKLLEQLKKNQDKKQQGQQNKDGDKKQPDNGQEQEQKQQSQDGQQGDKSENQGSEKNDSEKNNSDDDSQEQSQDQSKQQADDEQDPTDQNEQSQPQQATDSEDNSESDNEQEPKSSQSASGSDLPLDEQQQKRLKQWFKQIPDDPSLLLRNKMKLESMQRGNTADSEQVW